MTEVEQKQLFSLASALADIAQGAGQAKCDGPGLSMGSVIGGANRAQGINAQAVQPQSEISRELDRLARATTSIFDAIEVLGARLSPVAIPIPEGAGCGEAIEGCGSVFGSELQTQALRAQSAANTLRAMAASLAT